jgi:hypothetical protein
MYYNDYLLYGLSKYASAGFTGDRSYDGFTVFPGVKPTSAAIGAAQRFSRTRHGTQRIIRQAAKLTRDSAVKELTDPGVAGKVLEESTGLTKHFGNVLGYGLGLAGLAAGGYGLYKMLNRGNAVPPPSAGLAYGIGDLQSLNQQPADPNSPSAPTDPLSLAEKYGPNAATAALTAAALYGGYKAYKKYNRPDNDSEDDY